MIRSLGSRITSAIAIWVLTGLFLGCGAGRTLVLQPPETRLRALSAMAAEGNSSVAIPEEIKLSFQNELERFLYTENAFSRGTELTIRYRFIQFDPGSQLARWFWGGIGNAGEGSITVEARYFDATQRELATIQAEGRIGSGFFGGDFAFALERAAEKISDFAKMNFK